MLVPNTHARGPHGLLGLLGLLLGLLGFARPAGASRLTGASASESLIPTDTERAWPKQKPAGSAGVKGPGVLLGLSLSGGTVLFSSGAARHVAFSICADRPTKQYMIGGTTHRHRNAGNYF
jgi:hypothetical protein